jgi:hypothetical protein
MLLLLLTDWGPINGVSSIVSRLDIQIRSGRDSLWLDIKLNFL